MEIDNKTIVLTGAARIGKTVAEALLAKGANLVVTYFRSKPELDFEFDKSKVLFFKADLSSKIDVQNLIGASMDTFNQIDGLVHMAATYFKTPWSELNEETWNKSLDTIAKSAFITSKAVADVLLKNPGDTKGKIVLISDWSVLTQPYIDYLPYNVAKSAIIGLTKSLAKELSPGITVNCIAPGPILKPDDLSSEDNDEVMKSTPLRRWGGPEEIAKAVLFLLDSDFTTGQVLFVDGGRSIS